MQQRFPRDAELWRRQIEQQLTQLCVDRDRLMKTTPQIPDPEAGNAFTGPLSPVPFAFRGPGGPASGVSGLGGSGAGASGP